MSSIELNLQLHERKSLTDKLKELNQSLENLEKEENETKFAYQECQNKLRTLENQLD